MATLANTIKKAEKLSGEKVRFDGRQTYRVSYKGETVQFMSNRGYNGGKPTATCFYTYKHARTAEDVQEEYFPGTFHDNVNKAFKFLDRCYPNK